MDVRSRWATFAGSLACLFGCALGLSSASCDGDDGSGATTGRKPSRDGGPGTFSDAFSEENQDGCAEEAKLVYVLTSTDALYSFDPPTLTFKYIGILDCGNAYKPHSMAVDRTGTAWVNYTDGALYKVQTRSARCEATAFKAGQSNFMQFGMAFSTLGNASKEEKLFVVSRTGYGVGTIDLTTFQLTRLGAFSGEYERVGAELTGTGDGRLFAFITTTPASLAEVDKANGATPKVDALPSVETGGDWAFSFWGGDFWFYTTGGTGSGDGSSQVTQYKLSSSRQLTVVKRSVGFRIVGAGVSTCAPVTPPK